MTRLISAVAVLAMASLPALADEKMPLVLKLVVKKESIAWPYELKPKEFEARLQESLKKKGSPLPKPPAIDAVVQITNTGTEKLTIHVDGDPNLLTLALKGPSVVTANAGGAFTTDFRFPKAVELAPGKSHEIKLTALADGFRRMSRNIYPTAPGEYKLSATYMLSTPEGGKGTVLKSEEAVLKIEEPK